MKKENIPNILTIGRILFIPIFVLFLSFGESPLLHGVAAIIFSLASITDYLDGYLARKWGVVSNFGKFADPMADKLLVMSAFIILADVCNYFLIIPLEFSRTTDAVYSTILYYLFGV